MGDSDRFDGLFMNVAQQAQGIEPLLDNLFGFLRRKTDFFTGASPEQIEELVLKTVRKHAEVNARDKAEKKAALEREEKKKALEKRKREEAASKAKAAASGSSAADDGIIELGADGSFDAAAAAATAAKTAAAAKPPPAPAAAVTSAEKDGGAAEDEDSDKKEGGDEAEEPEDKTPPPPGNGGTTDRYTWTQTLSEVSMAVVLPPGTKSKMLDVDLRNTRLKVAIKGAGGPVLVEGEFHKRVIVDDSLWTVEDGELVITLQKDNKMEWWKCVLVGDPEINTQKVQPENSKLGDLDAETRQTVEKMMFDQRQKAQGLPSSDELQKQEMLKKFMSAHPEMDFSKAKFS